MRTSPTALFVAIVALSLSATALAQSRPIAGSRPACVAASAQPVFNGTGYNHLVTVSNQCAATVACSVTTNVNPTPVELSVGAGQSRTVNTFFNSPVFGFNATVECGQR